MLSSLDTCGIQPSCSDTINESTSHWDALYCSHLWSNSNLRKAIIGAPYTNNMILNYCYTCKGKIGKYEIKSSDEIFIPNGHSTPSAKVITKSVGLPISSTRVFESEDNSIIEEPQSDRINSSKEFNTINVEINQCIPSISRQIDSSFRQKYTSYEMRSNKTNRRRLRKSLKGVGCIVNFSLTESSIKKRTQIQACSISVMIVAIVIISLILVNFTTPVFTRATNVNSSTTVVPTLNIYFNDSSSVMATTDFLEEKLEDVNTTDYVTTTKKARFAPENNTLFSNMLEKIRKNIRTFPKILKNSQNNRTIETSNKDQLAKRFCSCQTNQVCMLDENTGTSICKMAVDIEDPTGCGGLCALETEACQLVDRALGVRVCRLLTSMTCSPHEWRCRNGLCVPAAARCDGSIHCYDRSDEIHCECDLSKMFRCGHSISCFSNRKLCDGVIDCWDGFDEVNCTKECPEHQFTCTDGQCIPPSLFCDGYADCDDGSDEPHGCDGACGAHEMRCGNRRCVSRDVRCDGRDNCGDSTDEINCTS